MRRGGRVAGVHRQRRVSDSIPLERLDKPFLSRVIKFGRQNVLRSHKK